MHFKHILRSNGHLFARVIADCFYSGTEKCQLNVEPKLTHTRFESFVISGSFPRYPSKSGLLSIR